MIPPASDQHKIAAVCAAMAAYLRTREPWQGAVRALAEASPAVRSSAVAMPGAWLEVTGAVGDPGLAHSLGDAASALCWRQNPSYTNQAFLGRYCYCELIGPKGHAHSDEYAVGLLYLAAHTEYPMHDHPAQECYHVLTRGSRWRVGSDDWQQRAPGDRILHDSGVAHGMRTHDSALLAIYLWRGAIETPARLAPHG